MRIYLKQVQNCILFQHYAMYRKQNISPQSSIFDICSVFSDLESEWSGKESSLKLYSWGRLCRMEPTLSMLKYFLTSLCLKQTVFSVTSFLMIISLFKKFRMIRVGTYTKFYCFCFTKNQTCYMNIHLQVQPHSENTGSPDFFVTGMNFQIWTLKRLVQLQMSFRLDISTKQI